MLDTVVDYQKDPNVTILRYNQVKIVNDLKESHPLQVAEFALAMGIASEPAFNWWVTWVLKKRDQIITPVKCQSAWYHKWTHKFGI
ncbi:hypothetical protein ACHAW6_000538 [Cyclotella cf. meneghiniana]